MKKRKLLLVIISILIIAVFSFIATKKVQADNLKDTFRENINSNNYEEAIRIFHEGNKDKITKDYFNFYNEAKAAIDEHIIKTKNKYLNEEIDYITAANNLKSLLALQELSSFEIDSIISELSVTEDNRKAYKGAVISYEGKKYEEAIDLLLKVSEEDKSVFEKGEKLKIVICKEYKEKIYNDIQSLVNKSNYKEAIALVSAKTNVLTKEEIDNKVKEINKIKAKKEEELRKKREEERKKAEEARRKRKEALIAKYLKNYKPNPEIEVKVKSQLSKTAFLIWVDLNNQITNVFVGEKGSWKLIKSFTCATGKSGNATPKGTFTISSRGSWFYSKKYSMGAKYWTRFYGNYLFHSVPMDINKNVLDTTLGTPASHGCIRLSIEDAKWIYYNVSCGTKVLIK